MTMPEPENPRVVWAAVFNNYEPAMVYALFDTEQAAQKYAERNRDLNVEPMRVYRSVEEATGA